MVNGVISAMTDSLARGEKVTLVGLGTFHVMGRKATKGVNPQTRETIQIPAKKVPKFVARKGLRQKVK
ncbi:MAG: HU family DNA-binding protein [bacterium]